MKTHVEIAGHEMIVEYDFKITAHSTPATGPSYSSGGEPGDPCEFEIEILGLEFPKQAADYPELLVPRWLSDILGTHLAERDDVIEEIQRAEYERDDED